MPTENDLPSRETLEDMPVRVFKFLIGLAASLPARAELGAKGFDEDEHTYAWTRLQKLGQIPRGLAAFDAKVRAATEELDVWDEPNFEAIRRTLLRQFPVQAAYVFEGLAATQGSQAVFGVELLLDRLDNLETGKGRDPTSREADAAALALLAKRGYPKEERTRLRGLVNTTKTITAPAPITNDNERYQILAELYRWHSEWSAQARLAIQSRRALIRLGLAKPRPRKAADVEADGPEDVDTEPAAPGSTPSAPSS